MLSLSLSLKEAFPPFAAWARGWLVGEYNMTVCPMRPTLPFTLNTRSLPSTIQVALQPPSAAAGASRASSHDPNHPRIKKNATQTLLYQQSRALEKTKPNKKIIFQLRFIVIAYTSDHTGGVIPAKLKL